MKDKEYIRQLEETLAKFLEPVRDIPYKIVIKVLTGCEVLDFDKTDPKNKQLLQLLEKSAKIAGRKAQRKGIHTSRPNEAGNRIEGFVLEALKVVGLKAEKPKTKSGNKKSSGYPDIEITDKYGRTIYLECKTFSAKTKNQTFRTFYLSPSKDPKITKNAFHLLLAYELMEMHNGDRKFFIPTSYEIYTLENLKVNVKHEFNASNRQIYLREFLLTSGKI